MQFASTRILSPPLPAVARRPRRLWPVLAATGALALVMGVGQCLAARQHLLRGAQQAQAALAVLHDPLRLRTPSERTALRARLLNARAEFESARQDLTPWAPVLSHLGWLPAVGPQARAAWPAADLSYRTTDAALLLIDGLTPALGVVEDRHDAGSRLPRLAAALAAGHSRFARARADMKLATADLRALPPALGNRKLDAMVRRLRHGVPKLRTATVWLALAPRLLGMRRPVHYLFVWQNPAELRATGGFLGASDLITVDHGRISHRFFGHQLPREITWPAMPLPEEVYTPESTWLFVDSNWSPDFPLSARFERWFYGEDTGIWADGVVNFLDTATPDLLRATGPVYLPAYHQWVNADNVTALAQRFINVQYRGPEDSAAGDARRKQFFFSVLKALLKQVQHLPLDRLPAIGRALDDMIRKKELLVYDRRPAVESAIRRARAAGRLSPGSADYLFVVDDNRSYNKLNPYVQETATDAITVLPTLWLDETLTIRYHVEPSPSDLEGGGPNWGLWGTKHDYQDFLRVYVPRGTRLVSMRGIDAWSPQPAYGATQLSGRILVREGQSATVVIHYLVPANVFGGSQTPAVPRRYLLRVQHQPGADLRSLTVIVRAGAGVVLGSGERARTAVLPLWHDTRISLGVGGRLHPEPIARPRVPAFSDPYIPFAYLHDPRHPL